MSERWGRTHHKPTTGMVAGAYVGQKRLEQLLHGESPLEKCNREKRLADGEMTEGAREAIAHMRAAEEKLKAKKESNMTVSLYTSTASGKSEIVVQTNAQSLDLFIAGLADAVHEALDKVDGEARLEMLSSLFRNAFPVAFAIAGYKAEKVVESRMLICGTAAPEKSSLLAHSRS